MRWRVGVVGCGIVGEATARSYTEYADVFVYDTAKKRHAYALDVVLLSDVTFICVPTEEVDKFFQSILGCKSTLVLRSTVPVGTTERLRKECNLEHLVHSPEFLTGRCAYVDACHPSRNIIGGPCEWPFYYRAVPKVQDLYNHRFPGVQVITCTSNTSEYAKLVQNAYFATKVAFFNEARTGADELGIGWEAVLRCVLSDGRIARSHTDVPGHDGKYGFGGHCLPRDLDFFTEELESRGLRADVSKGAAARNKEDRKR